MLDAREIDSEIAKWEALESSYPNYAKLAYLYVLRREMQKQDSPESAYSMDHAFSGPQPLESYGDSEFLQAVAGKDPAAAWEIMDDLMDTLRAVNPRVYDRIMGKIKSL